jgi:hypothetical protein
MVSVFAEQCAKIKENLAGAIYFLLLLHTFTAGF